MRPARGASIISFNPFRERALERFQAPQNPIEMVTLSSTPISSKLSRFASAATSPRSRA